MRAIAEITKPHTGAKILEWGTDGGAFLVRSQRKAFRVIASWKGGWDHVSVSMATRCPTWAEMDRIKRIFFDDDEVVVQFHVPPKDHINCHPYCLHLWRSHEQCVLLPPKVFV